MHSRNILYFFNFRSTTALWPCRQPPRPRGRARRWCPPGGCLSGPGGTRLRDLVASLKAEHGKVGHHNIAVPAEVSKVITPSKSAPKNAAVEVTNSSLSTSSKV